MSVTPTLSWIRQIDDVLVELDEKPQFGLPATFSWEELEQDLRSLLELPNLKISQNTQGWVVPEQITSGLGDKLLFLPIEWSGLHTSAYFLTDQQSLKELMSEIFGSQEAVNYFFDPSLVDGFYPYFASEILRLIDKQQFASPLIPRLGSIFEESQEPFGEESCFVIDVSLSFNNKNFAAKILLSESFRRDWKSYFAHLRPAAPSEKLKQQLMLEVSIEIAHSRLNLEIWQKVKKGDFVVLDQCSYDPDEKKGSVVMTLNQKPIFRGRLKDGGIKISDYSVYDEVSDAMEEDDLYKDFDEDEDSIFDEDEEDLFSDLEEPLKAKKSEKTEPSPLKNKEAVEIESILPQDLPIHLTVEIGRLKTTAGELMKLSPGNLLDINVSPEQGVDLVVNGKRIGRGELIKMGEVLGVRIISL